MERSGTARIVAKNLVRLREELDLTRLELSARSGVSPAFLSDLASGRGNPSLKTLDALAAALGTTVPQLLVDQDALPAGYEHVSAVLPARKAALVQRWAEETAHKLRKRSSRKGCPSV
jgi:transcriptional regulator with XRE-family HTH domain